MNYQKGVTALEVIISIAVFAVVFVAVTASVIFSLKSQQHSLESAEILSNARAPLLEIIKDIREASYSDIGDYPINSISSSSVVFFADIDRDANIEKVKYFLSGDSIYKQSTEATGTPLAYPDFGDPKLLAVGVKNSQQNEPLFRFYDKNGSTTENILDIASVEVNIWVDINPQRAPFIYNLKALATLRNLTW